MIFSRAVVAIVSGVIFGFGLALSGMMDPGRVQGFLDVTGDWSANLAFVLGGAVLVASLGVFFSRRMDHPLFDAKFDLPKKKRIDVPLIVGSAIFGIGWGLAGFCPGPAIASLSLGLYQVVTFVAAMIAGMIVYDLTNRVRESSSS